jgi:hypothetical protein
MTPPFARGDRVKVVPVDGPTRLGTVTAVPAAGQHLYFVQFDDKPGHHTGVHSDDLEPLDEPPVEQEPVAVKPESEYRKKLRLKHAAKADKQKEQEAMQPKLFSGRLFEGPYGPI